MRQAQGDLTAESENNVRTTSLRDLRVSRLGLGAMGMSGTYGSADEAESVRTLHRALDLGVTLLDTAEIYGPYHNEELVGRAIKDRRDEVVLATKVGMAMGDTDKGLSKAYIRRAVEASLRRLRAEVIDLYQSHYEDPETPIAETFSPVLPSVR